ncbi:SEC-C domain-containing protein [Paraburkholderia sp. Tr-20389]|uniref:SEC-C domain-containing protein n=1 Tax=Paraburkholderia sp. Tr-20389 TaxID=2703903 RepID=UPI00197EA36B|nr:SEC-C domain-containing protein [Paraburkholderia sp. Tr-20389]MBN3756080.1 SEC-C domain-containing protein [Paraburkholderia sp. Tr-20389]
MTNKSDAKLRCACGSGRKYKNCHALIADSPSQEQFRQVREFFNLQQMKLADFKERHGTGRIPVHTPFNNGHAFAVGNEIHMIEAGGFPDFIDRLAISTIGFDWIEAEREKPVEDRHQLVNWLDVIDRHNQDPQRPQKPEGFAPIGAKGTWLRMSYDLFTIRNNASLSKRILARLKSRDQFQGALYELCVTASFIAAGFEIEFEDETDNTRDHPEFVACDPKTGLRIAVEAKSRHRLGVHGHASGKEWASGQFIDVRRLLHDALSLDTEIPYYVFVDVNLPAPKDNDEYRSWLAELKATLEDCENHGFDKDDFPSNAVIFTNDPTHYFLEEFVHPAQAALWYLKTQHKHPKIAHPSEDMVSRVATAFFQRSTVPDTSDIPS